MAQHCVCRVSVCL